MATQVAKDEYDAFFKQTFKEFLEPLAHSHFNVEGTIEFTAMLFVPGMAPFEQQVCPHTPQPPFLSFPSHLAHVHSVLRRGVQSPAGFRCDAIVTMVTAAQPGLDFDQQTRS